MAKCYLQIQIVLRTIQLPTNLSSSLMCDEMKSERKYYVFLRCHHSRALATCICCRWINRWALNNRFVYFSSRELHFVGQFSLFSSLRKASYTTRQCIHVWRTSGVWCVCLCMLPNTTRNRISTKNKLIRLWEIIRFGLASNVYL